MIRTSGGHIDEGPALGNAPSPTPALLERRRSTHRAPEVDISGSRDGHTVVMLNGPGADHEFVDAVRQRLHIALLRTVVITPRRCPTPDDVLETLHRSRVSWSLLVADRKLGPLAWDMAARHRERFSGLIVVDCPHPRVANVTGRVLDPQCPPVLANTTALVSANADIAVAQSSAQYVHGQFRLATLAEHFDDRVVQLAAEIVVHTHSH
jgi:hypothetical protein